MSAKERQEDTDAYARVAATLEHVASISEREGLGVEQRRARIEGMLRQMVAARQIPQSPTDLRDPPNREPGKLDEGVWGYVDQLDNPAVHRGVSQELETRLSLWASQGVWQKLESLANGAPIDPDPATWTLVLKAMARVIFLSVILRKTVEHHAQLQHAVAKNRKN